MLPLFLVSRYPKLKVRKSVSTIEADEKKASGGRRGEAEALKLGFVPRNGASVYAPRTVQFHPDSGQFDLAWLPARTPHGVALYVW